MPHRKKILLSDSNEALSMLLADSLRERGFHVMQQLREGGHKISTIFMTALPTHKVIEEAYRLGASFVLPKPFTTRALAERIHDALHSDRP